MFFFKSHLFLLDLSSGSIVCSNYVVIVQIILAAMIEPPSKQLACCTFIDRLNLQASVALWHSNAVKMAAKEVCI
jgi:hypothetical protein